MPYAEINRAQVRAAKGLYVGYAADDRVRVMGSTGGVGRAFIHDALTAGSFDAVYSLCFPAKGDEEAQGRYLTADPANEDIPTSLYRPILWGKNLSSIDTNWKKVLLIGVPCQLKGAKKILAKRLKKDSDIFTVALICRQQKAARYTDYVKMILSNAEVSHQQVTYRGSGWPGLLGIKGQKGDYPGFMASARAFGQNLWRVPGCKYCCDCLGAGVVDITLADPWNYISETEDPKGSNILMVWTENGVRLIEQSPGVVISKKVTSQIVEKILAFQVIERKIDDIACRLGRERSLLKSVAFRLREKKITWLEDMFSKGKYNSFPVKVVCRIFK